MCVVDYNVSQKMCDFGTDICNPRYFHGDLSKHEQELKVQFILLVF